MSNKSHFNPAVRPLGLWIGLLMGLFFLAACADAAPTGSPTIALPTGAAPAPAATTAETAETAAPPAPSPTPTPALAALVNQQPITLEEYERELVRYEQTQAELNVPLEENYQNRVLLALVEQVIIQQAAAANQIIITPEMVQARITQLIQEAGGQENFQAWLQISHLSFEEFFERLADEMLTEQVVSLVTAGVPHAVEQVRARHIEVADPVLAQSLLEQLRAGADFATMVQAHSTNPSTAPIGGDLGFFAEGSLFVPEIEAAAFGLQPGEISEVIPVVSNGATVYHIVQVLERDPARPLDGNQRAQLLQETFELWLTNQLSSAEIVRFVE